MSEAFKKKKKKRHHLSTSSDFEPPNKRMKIETNDAADDSIMLSPPLVDLDCGPSDVECRQKKKHRLRYDHAADVSVNIAGHGNLQLNRTSTSGQYNTSTVSVDVSGLEKCTKTSDKRTKHVDQQDGPNQQQNVSNNHQTIDRLCRPELRQYIMSYEK